MEGLERLTFRRLPPTPIRVQQRIRPAQATYCLTWAAEDRGLSGTLTPNRLHRFLGPEATLGSGVGGCSRVAATPDRFSCSEVASDKTPKANKTRRSFFATQFRFKYGLVLTVKKIYPRDPSAYFKLCKNLP